MFPVETALGQRTSKKRPSPSPASSVSSDPESDSAAMDHPAGFAAALLDFSDSEDDSPAPVALHEKVLVDTLIASVRVTLKMEDAVLALASHLARRKCSLFPPILTSLSMKDGNVPLRSQSSPKALCVIPF